MIDKLTIKLTLICLVIVVILCTESIWGKNHTNISLNDTYKIEYILSHFDKDNDDCVSYYEAIPIIKNNFTVHDNNGDGFIDGEEVLTLEKYLEV